MPHTSDRHNTACTCDDVMRSAYQTGVTADGGTVHHDGEVDIYRVTPTRPIVQYHPAFHPFVATCPHGVTWCLQPTADQRVGWANRGIR